MSEGQSIGDKAKGLFKETFGKATGDTDAERAGEEQQKKGQKDDEAQRLEDEAQRKRNEAAGHEGEQTKRES